MLLTKLKLWIFIIVSTVFLVACSSNARETQSMETLVASGMQTEIAKFPTDTPEPLPDYILLNKELGSSNAKCVLDIRLHDRILESQIKDLAEYIKSTDGVNCSPLFIFYFLPGEVPGIDFAWAYSHYNPGLEVNINGLDLETKATLEALPTPDDENLVGIWMDTWAFSRKIMISKVSGAYEMTVVYGDGSKETKTLTVKFVDGEERLFEYADNYFGDYMVIDENRNLVFYDNEGFIYEVPPE